MSAPAWVNWNFGPTAGPVIMPPPSPYGALPGGNTSNLATLHGSTVFAFVGMNLTVLSCSVFGPYSTSTPHYQVISKSQGLDILETSLLEGGHQIGTIYWGGSTRVTLFNKSNPESHKAREWFVLSSDGVSRKMIARGIQYRWTTTQNDLLLRTDDNNKYILARIAKFHNGISLELTAYAISLELKEPALIATLLMMSGKAIV